MKEGVKNISPIKEKFVKTIESLPYDIDKEILKRSTEEIDILDTE